MSISCEIPSIQPAKYCEHGRFELTCEFCLICSMQHKINLLESQMKSLTDLCNDMNMRIYNLSEHRIWQIDENRKISKRVDEIAQWGCSHLECWNALDEKINDSNERIEKLEQYMKIEDRITASSVLLRLNELEDQIKILRTKSICEDHIFKSINNKQPHKCPVCEGLGLYEPAPSFNCGYTNCTSCDGKGIVWG